MLQSPDVIFGRVPLHRGLPRHPFARAAALSLPQLRRPARGRPRRRSPEVALRRRLDAPLRRSLQAHDLALWLVGVGQKRVGGAERPRRHGRVDGRRRHEPLVGRSFRARARHEGPVDQAVRQLAHRQLQGLGHDGLGLRRAPDDRRRQIGARRGLRVDGRHVGVAGGLLRGGGHSVHRALAARQGDDGAAGAADRQRRAWCCRSTPTSTAAWRSCSASRKTAASTSRTR